MNTVSNEISELTAKNQYLASIIAPWNYTSYIPDLDTTTSVLKTITISKTITMLGADALLIWRPQMPDNVKILSLYVPDAVRGGYTFVSYLTPDEDLSDSYSRARPASGGLKVLAATVSTTNSVLNGIINAADYQDLPVTRTLTFQTIPSFRRNPLDVLTAQKLSDGCVSLMHPEGQQKFRILESNSSENTDNILVLTYDSTTPATDGYNFAATNVKTLSVTGVGNSALPGDISGYVRIEVTLAIIPTGTQTNELNIDFNMVRKSATDWVTDVITTKVVQCSATANVSGLRTILNTSTTIYLDQPLESITFRRPNLSPTWVIERFTWNVISLDYYQFGVRSPGTLIGISGATASTLTIPGTQVLMNGRVNYEAVPDAQLARQIPTIGDKELQHPEALTSTMSLITHHLLRFLWPTQEYYAKNEAGITPAVPTNEKALQASGFLPLVANIVRQAIPILDAIGTTSGNTTTYSPPALATSSGLYRPNLNSAGLYKPRLYSQGDWSPDFKSVFAECKYETTSVEQDGAIPAPPMDGTVWQNPGAKNVVQMAYEDCTVANIELDWVRNCFPVNIKSTSDTAYHKICGVISSSAQFSEEAYVLLSYTVTNLSGFLYVSVLDGLDDTAFKAVCWAHAAAKSYGAVDGAILTIQVPDKLMVEGPSLGLAVFQSLIKRQTAAMLTGAIAQSQLWDVSGLEEKLETANSYGKVLIAPGTTVETIGIFTQLGYNPEPTINMGDAGIPPGIVVRTLFESQYISLICTKMGVSEKGRSTTYTLDEDNKIKVVVSNTAKEKRKSVKQKTTIDNTFDRDFFLRIDELIPQQEAIAGPIRKNKASPGTVGQAKMIVDKFITNNQHTLMSVPGTVDINEAFGAFADNPESVDATNTVWYTKNWPIIQDLDERGDFAKFTQLWFPMYQQWKNREDALRTRGGGSKSKSKKNKQPLVTLVRATKPAAQPITRTPAAPIKSALRRPPTSTTTTTTTTTTPPLATTVTTKPQRPPPAGRLFSKDVTPAEQLAPVPVRGQIPPPEQSEESEGEEEGEGSEAEEEDVPRRRTTTTTQPTRSSSRTTQPTPRVTPAPSERLDKMETQMDQMMKMMAALMAKKE